MVAIQYTMNISQLHESNSFNALAEYIDELREDDHEILALDTVGHHTQNKRLNHELNKLKSFSSVPKLVNHRFLDVRLRNLNSLNDLVGLPNSLLDLTIFNCGAITSLRGIQNCTKVRDVALQNLSSLNNLVGLPKSVQNLMILQCPKIKIDFSMLADLGLENMYELTIIPTNYSDLVDSKPLHLLKFGKLMQVHVPEGNYTFKEPFEIINSYLPSSKTSDIIRCQEQLIDAGFERFAEM